jgi:hypothetical protein
MLEAFFSVCKGKSTEQFAVAGSQKIWECCSVEGWHLLRQDNSSTKITRLPTPGVVTRRNPIEFGEIGRCR